VKTDVLDLRQDFDGRPAFASLDSLDRLATRFEGRFTDLLALRRPARRLVPAARRRGLAYAGRPW
jgi:hypothetical protein